MKVFRKYAILMSFIVFVFSSDIVKASSYSLNDGISVYQMELDSLNEKLSTDYAFSQDVSKEELYDFLSSMTIDEFRDYIINIDNTPNTEENASEQMLKGSLAASQNEQRLFYDNTSNYLFLKTNTELKNGRQVYSSFISMGSVANTYPCYKYLNGSYYFSNVNRTAIVTWKVYRCVSKYITNTNQKTIKAVFTAGEGDLYMSIDA